MKYLHKELIGIAFIEFWIVFFNNRYLEMLGLLALWAIIIRLRFMLITRNIDDPGTVLGNEDSTKVKRKNDNPFEGEP